MTDKNTLKQKLEETKAMIKSNSKDAHFAESLIDELIKLSNARNNDNFFPTLTDENIVSTYDGGSYVINIFRDGTAMYHTYGGYTVVADYRIESLNSYLKMYVDRMNNLKDLSDDEREIFELDVTSSTYAINIPMIAFTDAALKLELATRAIEYINSVYDSAVNSDLPEDDMELNRDFYNSVVADKSAGEAINESVKS